MSEQRDPCQTQHDTAKDGKKLRSRVKVDSEISAEIAKIREESFFRPRVEKLLRRLRANEREQMEGHYDPDPAKRDTCANCAALDWRHTEAGASNGHSLTRVCGHCGRVEYFSFGVDGWEAVHYQGKGVEVKK